MSVNAVKTVKFKSMTYRYQDIWLNGMCIAKGLRDCETRYEAIRTTILENIPNPNGLSVLDVGANEGYFSFRLAEDFESKCFLIEKDCPVLEARADLSEQDIHVIDMKVTGEDLEDLAAAGSLPGEQFDVILALSILHHFGKNWIKAAEAFLRMSGHVFIESPSEFEDGISGMTYLHDITEWCEQRAEKVIAVTPGYNENWDRPLWYIKRCDCCDCSIAGEATH